MRPGTTALFPLAVLSLLAAGTFWLNRATQVGAEGPSGKQRHDPDYVVDNFTVRRFDDRGNLQHFLVGDKMLHFPDDDATEVTEPKLTYYRTPAVHLSASKAWLDRSGKHVKLEGKVRVVRDAFDGNPATIIATSVLYARPDDEFAHTDAPVVITHGRSVMRGSGMESNDNTQISVLYGRASGTIFPKSLKQTDAADE